MPVPVGSSSSDVLRLAGAGGRPVDQGRSAMNVGDGRRQPQAPTGRLRPPADESVFGQLSSLLSALYVSRYRGRLAPPPRGILIVLCVNVVGQIRLNVWQGDFFNALEQHNLTIFGSQLLVFSV